MTSGVPNRPNTPAPPVAVRTPVWPMYRAMVGIGLACGILIVLAFQWTKPIIGRKRPQALSRGSFQVLPAAPENAPAPGQEERRTAEADSR